MMLHAMSASNTQPYPFLHFPYLYSPPLEKHADQDRKFQGIPSIAVTQNDRLWATWYGGGIGESHENYIMIAKSDDGGETWSDILQVIDPPFRASEPAVWVDPQGRLWWMANFYPGRRQLRDWGRQLWVLVSDDPDADEPEWNEPRLIAKEMNNFNMPTVLSDGRWLWPTGSWNLEQLSQPIFSDDQGETFYAGGGIPIPEDVRTFEEYQVVELKDGRLWLLTRTRYGIGQSFSDDGGKTWSEVEPSGIINAGTRFFVKRLQSGNILLVKNGPIDQNVGRSRMMAFVSKDDGQSWQGGLMLDERTGLSYPDGDQGSDGTIYVIYDRHRYTEQEILMAAFTEEDVLAGEPVSDRVLLRSLINKSFGENPEPIHIDVGVPYDDAEPVANLLEGDRPALDRSDYTIKPITRGAQIFSNRPHRWHEVPDVLSDKEFIQIPIETDEEITFSESGLVFVATPLPTVNRHTVQQSLLRQGFTRSPLPAFALFDHAQAETVLFQKIVEAGETIEIGYWGVVIF